MAVTVMMTREQAELIARVMGQDIYTLTPAEREEVELIARMAKTTAEDPDAETPAENGMTPLHGWCL